MDIVNFPPLLDQGRIADASNIDVNRDLIILGKFMAGTQNRRDGSQYPNFAMTIQTLLSLVPAPPGSSFNNSAYFVDAAFGNDGTAQPNRLDLQYQTINAALAAAPAGVQALIYVRNGTYNPGTLTAKDLVDFYFEPNTLLNNVVITDGGSSITFNVYGHLRTAGFCQPLLVTGGSTVTYEFDRIDTSGVAWLIAPAVGTANVIIQGNRVVTNSGFGFGSSFRGPANVSIWIRESYTGGQQSLFFREGPQGGYSGNFYMKCPEIIGTGPAAVVFVNFTTSPTARITIEGNITNTTGSFVFIEAGVYVRSGIVTINGNVTVNNAYGIATDGSLGGSGVLRVKGDVSSQREALKLSQTNMDHLFQQGLFYSEGLGTVPCTIIMGYGFGGGLNGQPNTIAYFKDCRVYNNLLDSNAIDLEGQNTGPNAEIYMYNCEGDSNGAAGEFVTTVAARVSGFHNVRATKANNAAITDVFTPTGFLVDAGFIIPNF